MPDHLLILLVLSRFSSEGGKKSDYVILEQPLIVAAIKGQLNIYTLHSPSELMLKLALRWSLNECVRAFFVQLQKFFFYGEVVFIHLDLVDNTCPITLISAS